MSRIVLLIILSGCASQTIDTELESYVDAFEQDSAIYGKPMQVSSSVVFTDSLNPGERGRCTKNETEPNQVQILKSYWNQADETSRKVLVYHELGHCELGRDHAASGIMNASSYNAVRAFQVNEIESLKQLFQRKETTL